MLCFVLCEFFVCNLVFCWLCNKLPLGENKHDLELDLLCMRVCARVRVRVHSVEGVCLVAGVKQPHLARVGLIGLGGGVGLYTCGALTRPHTCNKAGLLQA